jgi:Chaperone of endosialidase
MNPVIHLNAAILPLLIALVLTCFGLSPKGQAVVPPPDGGYPGFNTAEGQNALFSVTTGAANTAVGWFSLFSDTEGSFNTATGAGTLLFNTADQNTAFGAAALLFNTAGSNNTAVGAAALLNNNTGALNTAVGSATLRQNTDGNFNTAVGQTALFANTSGEENTATGVGALFFNTNGNQNTANGSFALLGNTIGNNNTAYGFQALHDNVSGSDNTAIGRAALANNTSGSNNTAIGEGALFSSTGNSNTALGAVAGSGVTTASNVICIGALGENVNDSCFINHIYSNVQPIVGTDPDSVTITSSGRLGRGNVSSRRYKHDVQPMEKASEALYALKPVSFRYNKEYDATQTLAFGLIAEQVAEVYPDLVGHNPEGQPESVRYEQVNAMLLNEFLKEHKTVQEQGATIAELKKEIAALTAGLQKVSAQLATASPSRGGLKASKFATGRIRRGGPAPQVVNNP